MSQPAANRSITSSPIDHILECHLRSCLKFYEFSNYLYQLLKYHLLIKTVFFIFILYLICRISKVNFIILNTSVYIEDKSFFNTYWDLKLRFAWFQNWEGLTLKGCPMTYLLGLGLFLFNLVRVKLSYLIDLLRGPLFRLDVKTEIWLRHYICV